MSAVAAHLLAVAAWAGAWAGTHLGRGGGVAWRALVVTAVAGLAVAWAVRRRARAVRSPRWPDGGGPHRRTGVLAAAMVAVALVAGLGGLLRARSIVAGPLAVLVGAADGGVAVEVAGRVVGDPDRHDGRWESPLALATLDVAGVGGQRTGERVLLRGRGAAPAMGEEVTVRGLAAPADEVVAGWLFTRGIAVTVDAADVVVTGPTPWWVARTTDVRTRMAEAAGRRLPTAHASLLTGLVVGDTSGQPEALEDAVRASGLSHLVAVSGSNVALVVGGIGGLVLLLGGGRRSATWLALGGVWWFVVLVRTEPSVVRAATMATLVLGAVLVGRVRDGPHLLASAVLLALLVDPVLAVTTGFLLSVAATAGVLHIAPPLAERWPGPRPVRVTLAATLGAQVAVAPVLLLGGNTVSAASVPANMVAIPAAAVASVLGVAAAVLSTWSVSVAGVVAAVARPALGAVIWSATTFAGPAGRMVDRLLPWAVALVVLLVVARRVPAVRRATPALVPVALALLLLLPRLPTAAPSGPVLVVLDVGQGDALLVGDPTAGWMLVDGGPDPGRLRDGLRDHGVDALAAVVVTHPHDDHDDGLVGLTTHLPIGMAVVGPPAGDPPVTPFAEEARAAGIPVHRASDDMAWQHGQMAVRVLSPPSSGIDDDANESSLVLRLDVEGGRSVLLTGDAEVIAQTRLLADPLLLDVDVLKFPHHGGDTNADGFLAATTPEVAVVSAGTGNPFGHPHPDVLADLVGVEVRRTDQDGDVVVPLN